MLNIEAIKSIQNDVGAGVTVVAATKTVPAEVVSDLKNHGITIAGENRVQELLTKYDFVQGISWHFIGRLQTNKVKYIVDKVDMIQSVDRPALVDEIQKQCQKADRIMDVLLEVNSGETSKGGIAADDIYGLADYVLQKPHLRLKGLMCIPAADSDENVYKELAALYAEFKAKYNGIEYLSLGMSDDYKIAVKFGANMIRPGRILFGERNG